MTRQVLIAGNWKMNLNHLEAIALVQRIAFSLPEKYFAKVEVAVLPPFTDIRSIQTLVDGDKLLLRYGAQDVSKYDSGAYTGEVSAPMLARLGCTYVTVGHSERRQYHEESDELVNGKVKAAVKHEIAPILCIGEPLEVREASQHVEHTTAQLIAGLKGLKTEQVSKVVIAYEPVWAIGTGRNGTPEQAVEVHRFIRSRLGDRLGVETAGIVRILYGGSVKPDNVAALMAAPDIDGALVGGASLTVDSFVKIVKEGTNACTGS
jgi:triosephosphate isomerase (TIM)